MHKSNVAWFLLNLPVEPIVSLPSKWSNPLLNNSVATLRNTLMDLSLKPTDTNAQKPFCTNDIENVGKTARHHHAWNVRNFSIGDRDEAITWGLWTLDKSWVVWLPKDKFTWPTIQMIQILTTAGLKRGVDPSHLIPPRTTSGKLVLDPGPQIEILTVGKLLTQKTLVFACFQEDIE